MKLHESTIKLFKALPIIEKKYSENLELWKKTIEFGFIFSPEVIANFSEIEFEGLISLVRQNYGLSKEEMNSSFHKSWNKIKNTPIEQLVIEQIAHYMTTYGKDNAEEYLAEKEIQWGVENLKDKVSELQDLDKTKIQDPDYVYVPKEELKIPELESDIKLVIIQGLTKDELKDRLSKLLCSGIALKEETLQAALEVAKHVDFSLQDMEQIKNKEMKIALYDYLGIVPKEPVEFLRYAVYKKTGTALLIKNSELIDRIRSHTEYDESKLFEYYSDNYGLEKLSEIFYRFKPLFLAFRSNPKTKAKINRIGKLAKFYHTPLPEDFLNSITAKIKGENNVLDITHLKTELDKANIFRKIRLAYALKFRTEDVKSTLYKIRNGKSFATDFSFDKQDAARLIFSVVNDSIVSDIKKKVEGKKIFLPEYIDYGLPSSEKQFTGNFPAGTCIKIPCDAILGIQWKNIDHRRIDLDLSMVSVGTKIGWNGFYRSEKKDILFSGDMTDAKNGATELFYVGSHNKESYLIYANFYNYEKDIEVPFKIIIAKEEVNKEKFTRNYLVNPNNILAISNSIINRKQKMLGLLVNSEEDIRFYFAETDLGKTITSSSTIYSEHARQYLFNFLTNSISLSNMLSQAGAIFVSKKEDADIDLSPESITKDTILSLLL